MRPPRRRKARQEERRAAGRAGGGEDRPGTRYKEKAEAEAGAQSGRLAVPSPVRPGSAPLGCWHLRPGAWAATRPSVPRWLRALGEVTRWTGAAHGRDAFPGPVAPWRFRKSTRYESHSCHTSSGLPGGLVHGCQEALLWI